MAYIISYSCNLEEHFGFNCKRIVILQTVLVHIKMEGIYGQLQHMSIELILMIIYVDIQYCWIFQKIFYFSSQNVLDNGIFFEKIQHFYK